MKLLRIAAAAMLGVATTAHAEGPPAGTDYADHAGAFVEFYDATEGLDPEARVAAFKREVAPLFPGFYSPRNGSTQEQVDARIRRSIEEFPSIREEYETIVAEFPETVSRAREHFRRFFPESTAALPTYLLHSLGEMDGGTREIDGQAVMVFGADGIAKYHSPEDVGPFFDHEFIHVEQGAYFTGCSTVWCSLWEEGLATAAAARMNPAAGPAALMLTIPRPIQPEVDSRWLEALHYLHARIDSAESDDHKAMFQGNGGTETLPPRWGYYVGYRLAERLLRSHELAELAHMPKEAAEPLVKAELEAMIAEAADSSSRGHEAPGGRIVSVKFRDS